MRKILHLIPTLEGGGAERQLAMLAVEQSSNGNEVHIALRRSNGVYMDLLRNTQVKMHLLGDLKSINPLMFLRICSLMRRLNPDVVQTWLPQMDVTGGAVALWNSIPLVVTERASKLAFDRFNLLTWLRKQVGRCANAVVANSVTGAGYWQSILPKETILNTIPNAVDIRAIQNFAPVSNEVTQNSQKIILVVGRLSRQKAVEIVLNAISLISERGGIRVIIMGDGPLRFELEELIDALKIGNNVVMLPFQLGWWGWLKNADALISMSRYEGNPNVVIEAMAAGCPLIVSDIPEHREILTDESAYFVPVENSIELAAAIEKLFGNPDLAHMKSELATKLVASLTIRSVADAYEDVYASMIKRKALH
jgi:glycosyltransferase involved in cell wall biosynthesis